MSDQILATEHLQMQASILQRQGECRLPRAIVAASMMPAKAAADALHVAAAAVAGVQHPLTLNCKHIANACELPRVYRLLDERGFGQLLICTPAEFLGGDKDDDEESDS